MASSDEPEIWKDIPDYEGYYQASSEGRIRSVERTVKGGGSVPTKHLKGKVLSPLKLGDKTKYLSVLLSKNGVKAKCKVHHAILITFKGPKPSPELVARHLNDDETNNRPSNLEWGTQSQNSIDKFKNGYQHHGRKLSDEDILKIQADSRPQRVIARDYRVRQATIWDAV